MNLTLLWLALLLLAVNDWLISGVSAQPFSSHAGKPNHLRQKIGRPPRIDARIDANPGRKWPPEGGLRQFAAKAADKLTHHPARRRELTRELTHELTHRPTPGGRP